ncbi:hypothetical protein [Aeromonas enteropelogenes]|uniref:hypothetical protein n=1 Tax=Aeromonas enteropelogenes TaxID=29489 RepID=UPI003BA30697
MNKIIKIQLFLLLILIAYPLLYSTLWGGDNMAKQYQFSDIRVKITNTGTYTQWSVYENEKLIQIRRSICFRVSKNNFIYYIFDRKDVSGRRLKNSFSYNPNITNLLGGYNPFIIVSYVGNSAKVLSFNGSQVTFSLVEK